MLRVGFTDCCSNVALKSPLALTADYAYTQRRSSRMGERVALGLTWLVVKDLSLGSAMVLVACSVSRYPPTAAINRRY